MIKWDKAFVHSILLYVFQHLQKNEIKQGHFLIWLSMQYFNANKKQFVYRHRIEKFFEFIIQNWRLILYRLTFYIIKMEGIGIEILGMGYYQEEGGGNIV